MICLFRKNSTYRLFSMIVLCLFYLTCLICCDYLSIVEGLLFFIFQVETAQMATVYFLLACSY